jgi:hypothetical protein
MAQAAPPSPHRPDHSILPGLLYLRPRPAVDRTMADRTVAYADDAVARGLATAQVYAFASVDYPGAATSLVLDTDPTTAVGAFDFGAGGGAASAFTFVGGAYQMLTVPNSTMSIATATDGAGVIIGIYQDLSNVLRGFVHTAGSFTDLNVPAATATQAVGINSGGQIVGSFLDAAAVEHGFLKSGGNGAGAVTAIDFPGACACREPCHGL